MSLGENVCRNVKYIIECKMKIGSVDSGCPLIFSQMLITWRYVDGIAARETVKWSRKNGNCLTAAGRLKGEFDSHEIRAYLTRSSILRGMEPPDYSYLFNSPINRNNCHCNFLRCVPGEIL